MRLSTVRTGVAALAAALLAAMLLLAALPWIASTQIVRDRIAYELSLWSGYRVSLGEAPKLDVWPAFKATLNNVKFQRWAGGEEPPVLEADRLEVSMSALAALQGDVVLSAVSMFRPVLRLTEPGPVIDLPAAPGGGRMTRAVETARRIVDSSPANPDLGALPADSFGSVEFFEGRIVGGPASDTDIVTALSGRISWPSLNRPARLTATGIWRGENITVEGSSEQPLMLLAGGNAPVKASLKSPLIDASFDGKASLAGEAFFDGQARLASPSLRRMLEWSDTQIAPGAAIGAVSIAGRIQGTAARVQIDNVELNLGGNVGRGVLEVSFAEHLPAISGTLAFDTLDFRSFLSAFMPIASADGTIYDEIDTGFADQIALDLRLSAATATLGSITMTDLAATSQVKGSLAAFDISGANAFGGTVQAGVRVDTAGDAKTVEMRAITNGVDAFALSKALGAERLLPEGRANISAILKGTGHDWDTVLGNAEGSITASLGQGTLTGFNLESFKERWSSGDFFPLSAVSDGSLPVRGMDFQAKVTGGVARIEKADVLLEGQVASIVGIVPYFSKALALSGHFAPINANGERGPPQAPFFIGGAWDAPFVSPVWPTGDFE